MAITKKLPKGIEMVDLIGCKQEMMVVSSALIKVILGGKWPDGFDYEDVHCFRIEDRRLVPYDSTGHIVPLPDLELKIIKEDFAKRLGRRVVLEGRSLTLKRISKLCGNEIRKVLVTRGKVGRYYTYIFLDKKRDTIMNYLGGGAWLPWSSLEGIEVIEFE